MADSPGRARSLVSLLGPVSDSDSDLPTSLRRHKFGQSSTPKKSAATARADSPTVAGRDPRFGIRRRAGQRAETSAPELTKPVPGSAPPSTLPAGRRRPTALKAVGCRLPEVFSLAANGCRAICAPPSGLCARRGRRADRAASRPTRAPPADRSSYNIVNWGPAPASDTAAGPLRLSGRPSQWHLSRATGISYP